MSSTITCKYFLRNECRFGDNCRFYHPRGGSAMGNPNVAFGNRNLGGGQNYNAAQSQDIITLSAKSQQNMDAMAEMVKKDMVEWELSKIYPFSTYGPAGSKPCLPGFEDISQEELRYQYLQNNKRPPDMSQQMRSIQQSRINYQQSTPVIRNILERVIVKGEKISENTLSGSWGSTTPALSNPSVFGGSTFGNSTASTGLQGISSGAFGANNSSFPFGTAGNVGATIQTDGMESTEGNSLFSQAQQSNTGLFSTQGQPQSQGFGAFSFGQAFGSSQTQSQSLAQPQQSNSLFQAQQPFGQGQQQQQTGLFQTTGQNQQLPYQSSLQSLLQQPPNAFQSISNQPQLATINTQQPQPGAQAPLQSFPFSSGDSTTPGTAVSSSGVFGGGTFSQPAVVQPSNSIFGAAPNQTVGSLTVPTVSSASTGVFGGGMFSQPAVAQPSNSIFGATTNLSVGNLTAPTVSSASSGIFGGTFMQKPMGLTPPTTPSIFGAPQPDIQTSTSIFEQPKQTPSIFPVSSAVSGPGDPSYAYSQESDLTQEELDAFRADHFTLENIPIHPPPKSYCI